MTGSPPFTRTLFSRRQLLRWAGSGLAALLTSLVIPGALVASPREAKMRLAELTGGRPLNKGRITIELPAIAHQTDFIPVKITVDSPMSADDYVKALHICSERNPDPAVASFHFTPESGRAQAATRIRLVKSQVILAAAEMSDGSCYYAKAFTKISTGKGGCG